MNQKKTQILELQEAMQKILSGKRYLHSISVAYTAASMAMCYQYEDLRQVIIAGLLHDCAKQLGDGIILERCLTIPLSVSEVEARNPFLLHGKLGAYIAKNEYEIEDEDILSSIEWHTTGKPNMTMLEKFIFLADYIEPYRAQKTTPGLLQIREISFRDIDYAMCLVLENTLRYLRESETEIDPQTQVTYDYYKELFNSKGEQN